MVKKEKINKAAKIREMLAKNPDIKFPEVEAEFKKLGLTVAAAQFYTLKANKPAKKQKIKIKLKEKPELEPATARVTSVAAKASSTTTFDTDTLLMARNVLHQAYRDALKMIGRLDVVDQLYADVRNTIS